MSRCSSAKVFGGSGMPSGVCTVARRSAALRRVGLKLRMPSRARVYRRTGNLRAVQLLLGHKKIESTVRYLGIEVDDALAIAEQVDV
jgi:site-specific recombinase XerC